MNLKADGPDCKMVFKFGSRVERLHSARKPAKVCQEVKAENLNKNNCCRVQ